MAQRWPCPWPGRRARPAPPHPTPPRPAEALASVWPGSSLVLALASQHHDAARRRRAARAARVGPLAGPARRAGPGGWRVLRRRRHAAQHQHGHPVHQPEERAAAQPPLRAAGAAEGRQPGGAGRLLVRRRDHRSPRGRQGAGRVLQGDLAVPAHVPVATGQLDGLASAVGGAAGEDRVPLQGGRPAGPGLLDVARPAKRVADGQRAVPVPPVRGHSAGDAGRIHGHGADLLLAADASLLYGDVAQSHHERREAALAQPDAAGARPSVRQHARGVSRRRRGLGHPRRRRPRRRPGRRAAAAAEPPRPAGVA